MHTSAQIMITLLLFSAIGGLDELIYHNLKFNILAKKECFRENILHIARGYLFFFIFNLVAFVHLQGAWALIGLILLAMDLTLSVLDILEEPRSRKLLGGLPKGEYLIHMCLAFTLGVFYWLYVQHLFYNFNLANSIQFFWGQYPVLQILLAGAGLASLGTSLYGSFRLRRGW